jgi:hypothetical protein
MFFCFRHEGTDSQSDLGDVIVVLNNFKSKTLKVQVCDTEGLLLLLFSMALELEPRVS